MFTTTTAVATPTRTMFSMPLKTAVSSSTLMSYGYSTPPNPCDFEEGEEEVPPTLTVDDYTYAITETPTTDYILMQLAEDQWHPRKRRDITIGTLDDSLTISVPENPAGTGAAIKSFPTVTNVSPVETPATAGDASSDPPEGGDLNKITEKTCGNLCTKGTGSGGNITVWDNYSSTHNGTHITTNHTIIYCDSDCIAHSSSTMTDVDTSDGDDTPTTAVSSAVASSTAASSAAASSAAASGAAGSVKLS